MKAKHKIADALDFVVDALAIIDPDGGPFRDARAVLVGDTVNLRLTDGDEYVITVAKKGGAM